MPDSLYDIDFPTWAEQQADLLASLARGERVNAQVDWPHVIEEVQDLGRSDVQAVENLLALALQHILKVAGWPVSPLVNHWSIEARAFLQAARRRWAPSMAQRIELQVLYTDALDLVEATIIDGASPEAFIGSCPFTFEHLIVSQPAKPDIARLAAMLRAPVS
jgi:hypothetical protein